MISQFLGILRQAFGPTVGTPHAEPWTRKRLTLALFSEGLNASFPC